MPIKQLGGGIFVTYPYVSDSIAHVQVKTDIINEYNIDKICRLKSYLLDSDLKEVASVLDQQNIETQRNISFTQTLTVKNPKLWHPDNPSLYTLVSEVVDTDGIRDRKETRIGIRRFKISPDSGFSINGKRLVFMGTNRVQDYPYVAWALPNLAQRRDAVLLREAGFQYVRCSHNPQDPSFLDACDELGLLVMDCIPGFQYVGGAEFKKNSFQTMREIIRRDRNHASVVFWELSLNESNFDTSFARRAMEIGHEEFPDDQCFVAGWKHDHIYDVFICASQHGARNYNGNKPLVISEYGHWDYGAGNSTSDTERMNGEESMLIQAKNHQESLNANRALPFLCGDGLWVGIDFQTYPSGVLDYFRLPKFSYYFYQSQRDPYLLIPNIDSGPMIFIANFWTENSPKDVTIYSNCDSVRLLKNGKKWSTQLPDRNENTTHLLHPPFTFTNVTWQSGEIEAVGFIGSKPVISHIRRTPFQAQALMLETNIDKKTREPLDDLFFVYAKVVDEFNTMVPSENCKVKFEVLGPGQLVSPNEVNAEAGIGTALVRSFAKRGTITIKASAKNFEQASYQISFK